MRKGFTLIELMIVIAIIAIIAAIAIPNLLESRISSNEAAAATSLKSGVFPAEVNFQAGTYADVGGPSGATSPDGIGDYAGLYPSMAGNSAASTAGVPTVALSLLPPTWDVAQPNVNNYFFNLGNLDERAFCAACYPTDQSANIGRRCFAINTAGTIYSTLPASTNPQSLVGTGAGVPFGAAYSSSAVAGWTVYRR